MAKRSLSKAKRSDAIASARSISVPMVHADAWVNSLTGVGQALYDKRLGARFRACYISDQEAEDLWASNDIAARIVEALPELMCKEGARVHVADDKDSDICEAAEAFADDIEIMGTMQRALEYAQAYGGGAVFLGVDDGQPPESELRLDKIRSFNWALPMSKRELRVATKYRDRNHPKFGKPETYAILAGAATANPDGTTVQLTDLPLIHESRLIVFQGVEVSRRRTDLNGGWGHSIFERIADKIRDFDGSFDALSLMLGKAGQTIVKFKGVAQAMGMQKDDMVTKRAQMIELCRSICRALILDIDEEFSTEPFQGQGFGEAMDKQALRIAAAARMPVTILMGQAPAGLNATGDSDMRWWFDTGRGAQRKRLKPALNRFYKLAFLCKTGPTNGVEPDNWSVSFPSPYQLSEAEKSKLRLDQSQADVAYVQAGILTPEEVAMSRFGGDEYSTETKLDLATREAFQAAAKKIQSADPNTKGLPPGQTRASLPPNPQPFPSIETGGARGPAQGKGKEPGPGGAR